MIIITIMYWYCGIFDQRRSRSLLSTAQKMKFSMKDYSSKCNQIHCGFGHIIEESLNRKLHFLYSVLPGTITRSSSITHPDKLLTTFEPRQKLSTDSREWRCVIVIIPVTRPFNKP